MFGSHTTISRHLNRARHYLSVFYGKYANQLALSFLIQDIGDTEQVPGRPDMDINFFCRPGICMAKDGADKLKGYTFPVQICSEIVPKRMRSESRYPGVPGKFFTQAV